MSTELEATERLYRMFSERELTDLRSAFELDLSEGVTIANSLAAEFMKSRIWLIDKIRLERLEQPIMTELELDNRFEQLYTQLPRKVLLDVLKTTTDRQKECERRRDRLGADFCSRQIGLMRKILAERDR